MTSELWRQYWEGNDPEPRETGTLKAIDPALLHADETTVTVMIGSASRARDVPPDQREQVIRDWEGTIETDKYIASEPIPAGTTITQEMIDRLVQKAMNHEAEEIARAMGFNLYPTGPRRYDNPNAIEVEYNVKQAPKGELPAGD